MPTETDTQILRAVYQPEYEYLKGAVPTAEDSASATAAAVRNAIEADKSARRHLAGLQKRLDDLVALAKRDGVELK